MSKKTKSTSSMCTQYIRCFDLFSTAFKASYFPIPFHPATAQKTKHNLSDRGEGRGSFFAAC